MTDTAALIAEAREAATKIRGGVYPRSSALTLTRLADALEAATKDAAEQAVKCNNARFDLLAKASPRVVSTVAEVNALPKGSCILDSEPAVMYRNFDDGFWWVPGNPDPFKSTDAILPATVLWVGCTE